ncbi:MAG: MarR family transcriptional regulator [Pseudomonadota bacterium]|jgi:Transcriptional regulators|nr:MAG: MarR family transcriptional regulator [Pseudomonadota bacterium]
MGANRTPVEQVRLGVLNELVGFHIRRAANAFMSDFNETFVDTGVRQILLAILFIVDANPGIYQGQVGRALGIRRANMVALATELEERGLIKRKVPATNRRALSLTLTDRGREVVAACLKKVRAHERRLLSGFTNDERALLIDLLARIATRMPVPEEF